MYHPEAEAGAKKLIADCGLPENYPTLNPTQQRMARFRVLFGWFDSSKPWVFCTDQAKYVQARKLWDYLYLRRAECNKSIYYWDDPDHKYDMVRALVNPPTLSSEPSKTVLIAPRGSAKTRTNVHDTLTMVACVRGPCQSLVTEINLKRTKEEMRRIRTQLEENEFIHRDFGSAGELFPRPNSPLPWNDEELTITKCPDTTIFGVSVGSSQRGRRILCGVLDDLEDLDSVREANHVNNLLEWLFRTYRNMFRRGGAILMQGTYIKDSVIAMAVHGKAATEEAEEGVRNLVAYDERFDDWTKLYFPLIYYGPDGKLKSRWKDYISEDEFELYLQGKGMGRAAAMTELQGEPISDSESRWKRNDVDDGFMHAVDDRGVEYCVNLRSGKAVPWVEWLASLAVFGGGDFTHSISKRSDPYATVFVGVDRNGEEFVLDVVVRKKYPEFQMDEAYELAAKWNCRMFAWDAAGPQKSTAIAAIRMAKKKRDEGKIFTHAVEMDSKVEKIQRIRMTLSTLLYQHALKFMHFQVWTDPDGKRWIPAANKHRAFHELLKAQVDNCSDDIKKKGGDDAVDALEMAVRLAGKRRGRAAQFHDDPNIENEKQLERWKEAGITIDPVTIPVQLWSKKMLEEHGHKLKAPLLGGRILDPYE